MKYNENLQEAKLKSVCFKKSHILEVILIYQVNKSMKEKKSMGGNGREIANFLAFNVTTNW